MHAEVNTPKRYVNLMLDAYVCANCGYVEMYAADRSKLASLAQGHNWQKAGQAA